MSRYDYELSRRIITGDAGADPPFYAIIMAAMRKADTQNLAKLRRAFPDVYQDLFDRYNAPGGYLPGERRQLEEA